MNSEYLNWIPENKSGIILFLGFFVLYGLEIIIPLVPKKSRHYLSNFSLAFILVIVNFLFASMTWFVARWVNQNGYGLFNHISVDPKLLVLISIIFLDLWAGYFVHCMFHKFSWLWKFHSIHHSDDLVDVTTTFRQHPVETLIRIFFHLTGLLILGIPAWMLLTYLTVSTVIAQFEHANIRLPANLDRWLQYVIVTPHMHKVHHSRYRQETDSNYSNIFSFWDRIFRTYRVRRNYSTIQYGLDSVQENVHYSPLELLKSPFKVSRAKIRNSILSIKKRKA
ncbi:MAG TPA: sterol desaturase family protein [Cyclobacteriaceae bacterium]|nr:sterol desaturase family protein [Cyclobacteriaceae bacterium]